MRRVPGALTRIVVEGPRPYAVYIGSGALAGAALELARGERSFLLSDTNVMPRWADALGPRGGEPRHALEPGERSKSVAVLADVLERMVAAGLDRGSALVALGGGVVGDVGGLAAALFMRGIDVVQCPTSLLAQVDSSIGGKTAVNISGGKNLVGAFHPPRAVFADVDALATLPDAELRSGLGEVIKTALIEGGELYELVRERAAELRPGAPAALWSHVVALCVYTKGNVVAADERESGRRKVLNLGHTFAHAIEHAAGYGTVPHGIAVGTGLALACEASRELGRLEDATLPKAVAALLTATGLPATLAELRADYRVALEPQELARGMRHDKKGAAGVAELVLPIAPGNVVHGVVPEAGFLEAFFAAR